MRTARPLGILFFLTAWFCAAQSTAPRPPRLPLVDENACPFEGCTFGKWIVNRNTATYSTWKDGRKPVGTLRKGEIATGVTGVHITFEPDRIQVLQPIPELHAAPGDIILRYMYRGEGFADIWVNGVFYREYDCGFVTEKIDGGCSRNCQARVVSDGRKEWWVQLRTSAGAVAWAKPDGQFDCMDALGGDDRCEELRK